MRNTGLYAVFKEDTDMRRFRSWYAGFMQGRYGERGIDEYGRFLNIVTIVFLLLSMLFRRVGIFYWIALALIIYDYYRLLSRDFTRRRRENDRYLQIRYNRGAFMDDMRRKREDAKVHKIFKCPRCHQKVRVPRGKGRISIRCPKCGEEFVKKS